MLKTLLLKLLNSLRKSELPPPKSTEEIDFAELYHILRNRFPDEGELYLSDKRYKLCNIDDVREFCVRDKTNHQKFVSEDYDCDDFSYRLMGQFSIPKWSSLALGIAWTGKHALNCFVDEGKHFYFLEPQKDAIISTLEDWQGSKVRFIMM